MPPSYGHAARLRLAVSELSAALADSATAIVPTTHDHGSRPGDLVASALQLVDQARELLDTAVACERSRATHWAVIGRAAGVSKQSAHGRWASRVQEIDARTLIAWLLANDEPAPDIPQALSAPAEAAAHLDRWAVGHPMDTSLAHPDRRDPANTHPVSAGLPTLPIADAAALVTSAAALLATPAMLADARLPELEIALARRRIALHEAILASTDDQPPPARARELADLLAGARARLAQLQRHSPTQPGTTRK